MYRRLNPLPSSGPRTHVNDFPYMRVPLFNDDSDNLVGYVLRLTRLFRE